MDRHKMPEKFTYRVNPLNAKERTRIAEHGDVWETATVPHVLYPDRKLLSSVKTGYHRWWTNLSINPVDQIL